jgi:hypothetical protein
MQESNLLGRNIDSYCTKCRKNSEHTIDLAPETCTTLRVGLMVA